MRKISDACRALLESGVYSVFVLTDFEMHGVNVYNSTLPYDVTIENKRYSADHGLVGLDPPSLDDSVDKSSFRLKYADPKMELAAAAKNLGQSRVTVRVGFYNTIGESLRTSDGKIVDKNQPILNYRDMLIMYRGYVDAVRYQINEEEGSMMEIVCGSPMSSLDAVNSFYTTRSSVKQRVPADWWQREPDTCFDNVSRGGKAQEVLWGKM